MKRYIPNTITCCNLVCGCIATVCAISGSPVMALLFIILGAVFDFFDGMSARLLHVSSDIGKELDSLADNITFGMAPASIIFYELRVVDYPDAVEFLRPVIPYFAYVVSAFSALRLAKFNLDARQSTSFIGLPTPANALFWGSFIVGFGQLLEPYAFFMPLLLLGVVVSSWLLVAEIPMFALKFKYWSFAGNEIKYLFAAFSAVMIVATVTVGCMMEEYNLCYSGFSVIILAYILVSVARRPGQ
ncbi:MAG: CDP-diacylglycerol--serine O-phosphatidyltransferase [Prevotellaceae bacterium]|nr:CDP-diacylglycerol--serine O-phosphatidyltransferase [Prevotellaceae bacterium]